MLQSTAGNSAVQHALNQGLIQAKLSVSQPHDPDEQDADRVAERVMRMADPVHSGVGQGKGSCPSCAAAGSICSTCAATGRIQRSADHPAGPPVTSGRASLSGLQGGGRSLPHTERSFFEPRFGRDFSNVRIHTDAAAGDMARGIHARAFTAGSSIAFAPGEFRQDTSGRALLAHELAHVVQNSNGSGPTLKRKDDGGTPDAGPAAPAPVDAGTASNNFDGGTQATVTRNFQGVVLSDDPAYTYDLLKKMIIASGFWAMQEFVDSFASDVSIRRPSAGISDDPDLNRDSTILGVLQQQFTYLKEDRDSFIGRFEDSARLVAEGVLDESQQVIMSEVARYGLTNIRVAGIKWPATPDIRGDLQDNASTRGLAIAAKGLLDRKRKYNKLYSAYQDFTHGAPGIAELGAERFNTSDKSEIEKHREGIFTAERDLQVFRVQVQTRFPILAALSSDEDFKYDDLEALSKGREGPTKGVGDVVAMQVFEKLTNILKVRKELKPSGDINVWLVPKLVAATRDELKVEPGSMYDRIANDKINDEKPSTLTEILKGIVQIGLVILAPATGGLTLIPAAAMSVHTAYTHYKEYELKSAMRGTHFGAGALSAEEPSLFWLAVDIIGAGFDVGAAVGPAARIFRSLAPAAKALREGEITEQAIRNIEREATELGGKKLGEAVGRDARALKTGSKEVGITADEARQLEQAAKDVAAKELNIGAQSAETIAGGKATVSKSGAVWSCQSPCITMRERFRNLLGRKDNTYLKRLNDIEERASKLPATADKARQELANEAAALEREMRTTSLPGDWASPLSEGAQKIPKSEWDDLVKRRGSVAAELDHHPPGWTGKDEARFRYGLTKGEEAEVGYRWTMDENGMLRYERMNADGSLKPRRYNAATGEFEDAVEEGFIAAKKGSESATDISALPKDKQKAMDAAFKERRKLIERRDKLEALEAQGKIKPGSKQAKELQSLYAEINEQSRQLGEKAAEGIMSGKGKKLYPLTKTHSTSGDFDQVWKVGDEFHIVEAKGGSSGLGSRAVGEGIRAEQGTLEYAKAIAENMATNGATPAIRKLGAELKVAIANGKVKYVLVRAPIVSKGGTAVLGEVKVSEFVLSGAT